ncbi:MAG TPA: glycosyltransferase family 1 protein [Chthoniobacterales bacterium]|jgi:glycosyltransferase involved in cell wall biosynthesis
MPYHIVIDGCCLGRRKTGNETYIRGLLSGLAGLPESSVGVTVLTTPACADDLGPHFNRQEIPLGNFVSRNFMRIPSALDALRAKRGPLLYHATYWTRFWDAVPKIVTIHDLSFVSLPSGFRTHERMVYRKLIRAAANGARHILTVSEFSKQELMEKWQIPAEKITVTYEAADACFRLPESQAPTSSAPYLLSVGNLHPRKNLVRLLKAFVKLKLEAKLPHRLRIVGQKAWLYDEIFDEVRRRKLEAEVEFTGYVSQQDLVWLYQNAAVFIYPSLYEGFGLPVLEAMACGCPVVCSSTTSLPEVAGDAAELVDPHSEDELARGIIAALGRRDELRSTGVARAASFSWEKCAQETAAAYVKIGL